MSPDDNKVETINDDLFSTFEEVEGELLLVGGSIEREHYWELVPDGTLDWSIDYN